jgi:putative acetyltransferase
MLTEWARLSKSTVVVLGGVPFYERAGFSAAPGANLTSPYPISRTMLAGEGSNAPSETLIYPQSFSKLD